ncbi:ATP-binding protein [Ruania alkalisoli]|uniref:ATP-binding protein n=1 Tax=Ruania alkalisoli TaxID=2779775 RepID=A0A7M1SSB5_9MICO|nr:ATP-binding protein [Ruania alkalisoli]QOR70351.1 ATP-binding protein [Ruania alkalisoli]
MTTHSLTGAVLAAWEVAVERRERAGVWAGTAPAEGDQAEGGQAQGGQAGGERAGRGLARAALAALLADRASLEILDAGVGEVAERFGLSFTEQTVLTLACLPEAHPSAHLLAGLLSGDDGAARPSVALAWESAGLGSAEPGARRLLERGGRLRRYALVGVEGDGVLLSRRLAVPDRVVSHVLGAAVVPQEVERVLVHAPPVDMDGSGDVADALAGGESLVWVRAAPGAAAASLAVAACRRLGVACVVADLERAPSGREAGVPEHEGTSPDPVHVRHTLAALTLEAGLEGAVLVLLGAQHATAHLDLIDRAAVPVVAVASIAWEPRWAQLLPATVTATRLSRGEREALWREAIAEDVVGPEVVAARIMPEEIELVAERARADARRESRAVGAEDVRRAVRMLAAGHHAYSGGTPATLDDLVLPDHVRVEVERLIGWARNRDEVLGLGDLQGKGGKGTGICALFSGSPGTGKTLAAHVLADALGADLFGVDLSSVVDKYIGETEKNLERVFAKAESLNAVLFFDEADALFGSRSAVTDSRDRYANQEVAYLLQRMEAFEGITVLATNLRGNLDPAFARRLHFMVHFPDPDAPTRRRLWEQHLAQLPGTAAGDPVDLDLLAESLEIAGGDVRNIVLAATYDAVAEQREVGMADLRRAAEREMAKLGRRVTGSRWAGSR